MIISFLPPKPEDEEKAIYYVSQLKHLYSDSDFEAIYRVMNAVNGGSSIFFGISLMVPFMNFVELNTYSISLAVFSLFMSMYCQIAGERLEALLKVFDDKRSFAKIVRDGGSE